MEPVLTPQRDFTPQPSRLSFFAKHKKGIIIGVLVILAVGTGGYFWYQAGKKFTESIAQSTPMPTATPTPSGESLINGVRVGPDLAKKRPSAVMIENAPDARPQVGLVDADMVFEALVEGNITRFMAIYAQKPPQKAGPIRSARSYFLDYSSEFDAIYVHAGGSPTALARISEYGIKNYPHSNDGTFRREPRAGVASEHTLFANIAQIMERAVSVKKWSNHIDAESWKFKDPDPSASSAGTVSINFSGPNYQVSWIYDPSTGKYSRNMAGRPHLDRITQAQIAATTIIAITVQRSPNPPYRGTNKESEWTMQTIGSGMAAVYQDGKEIKGTWKKPSRTERLRLYDENSAEITINRGVIWVEIVPPTGSYSLITS